jgi:hypothetical protein
MKFFIRTIFVQVTLVSFSAFCVSYVMFVIGVRSALNGLLIFSIPAAISITFNSRKNHQILMLFVLTGISFIVSFLFAMFMIAAK